MTAIEGESEPLTVRRIRQLFRIDGKTYFLKVWRGETPKRLAITTKRVL